MKVYCRGDPSGRPFVKEGYMVPIYGMVNDDIFICENSNTYVYKKTTYKIAYDGLITNSFAIKQELLNKGYYFETSLEEEIILKAFIEYGFDSYNRFSGHFCVAIWNTNTAELVFMRDYYSIKKLYYKQDSKGNITFTNDLSKLLNSTYNEICYDIFVNSYLPDYQMQTNFITNQVTRCGNIMLYSNEKINEINNINVECSYIFDEVGQIVLSNLNNINLVKLEDKSNEVDIVAEYILDMLGKEKTFIKKKFSKSRLNWFLNNMALPFYNLAEYNLAFIDAKKCGIVNWGYNKAERFYNMNLYNMNLVFPWYCREKIVGIDEVYCSDNEENIVECKDEKYIEKKFKRLLKNKWINELNIKELDYYMKVYCIRLVNWMDKYNIKLV